MGSIDGSPWEERPGRAMATDSDYGSGCFQLKLQSQLQAARPTFVFTDGSEAWDNN